MFISSTDDFSFFAVLDFRAVLSFDYWVRYVEEELNDRIPNKTKLIFSQLPYQLPRKLSETLHFNVESRDFNFKRRSTNFDSVFVNILNKRWQTLDLVSMMRELKRSFHVFHVFKDSVSIKDSLSSLPRFIRKEPTV